MARRYRGNMNGEQYLGNTSGDREFHGLITKRAYQIDEVIAAGHDRRSRHCPLQRRRDLILAPTASVVRLADGDSE